MASVESPAEKRARLRRMKILADSEKRINRIIGGESEPSPSASSTPVVTSNCDNESITNSNVSTPPPSLASSSSVATDRSNDDVLARHHHHQISKEIDQSNKSQVTPCLPPRDCEPLPRKVSLISSPIHYKTLQLSQQYNSMLNHPNIINNLRCNSSAKFMFLLVFLSFVGSFFNINIPTLFVSYLLIKHSYNGIYRNIWFDINLTVVKELTTSIFSYVIVQVILQILSN